jgi:hypothetical protein
VSTAARCAASTPLRAARKNARPARAAVALCCSTTCGLSLGQHSFERHVGVGRRRRRRRRWCPLVVEERAQAPLVGAGGAVEAERVGERAAEPRAARRLLAHLAQALGVVDVVRVADLLEERDGVVVAAEAEQLVDLLLHGRLEQRQHRRAVAEQRKLRLRQDLERVGRHRERLHQRAALHVVHLDAGRLQRDDVGQVERDAERRRRERQRDARRHALQVDDDAERLVREKHLAVVEHAHARLGARAEREERRRAARAGVEQLVLRAVGDEDAVAAPHEVAHQLGQRKLAQQRELAGGKLVQRQPLALGLEGDARVRQSGARVNADRDDVLGLRRHQRRAGGFAERLARPQIDEAVAQRKQLARVAEHGDARDRLSCMSHHHYHHHHQHTPTAHDTFLPCGNVLRCSSLAAKLSPSSVAT